MPTCPSWLGCCATRDARQHRAQHGEQVPGHPGRQNFPLFNEAVQDILEFELWHFGQPLEARVRRSSRSFRRLPSAAVEGSANKESRSRMAPLSARRRQDGVSQCTKLLPTCLLGHGGTRKNKKLNIPVVLQAPSAESERKSCTHLGNHKWEGMTTIFFQPVKCLGPRPRARRRKSKQSEGYPRCNWIQPLAPPLHLRIFASGNERAPCHRHLETLGLEHEALFALGASRSPRLAPQMLHDCESPGYAVLCLLGKKVAPQKHYDRIETDVSYRKRQAPNTAHPPKKKIGPAKNVNGKVLMLPSSLHQK